MNTFSAIDFGRPRRVVQVRGTSLVLAPRSLVVAVLVLSAILALATLSLMSGDYPLTPGQVWGALLGEREGLAPVVVLEWRLPRVLAAVLLGGALALSGALFQTVTRNPLASPDVIGLSHGAFSGMLVTTLLAGTSWAAVTVGSLLGGLLAAGAIYLLALRGGIQGFRFIVVGIAISSMLASLNTWMLLQIELETAMFASAWGAGSLNGVTTAQVLGAGICVASLSLALVLVAPALRQLDLGDDAASALGVNVQRLQGGVILLGVALVCVATAVVGPISFVALAAPQVARRLAATAYLPLGLSALVGALVLLAADHVAQHVLPVSLPAGVVTVVLGGMFLVWMVIHEIRRGR